MNMRGDSVWGSIGRVLLMLTGLYALLLWIWSRIVTPRRVAALPADQRMRLIRWDDRLRLPAILALVPPTLVAAFGVYLPIATALQNAWIALQQWWRKTLSA